MDTVFETQLRTFMATQQRARATIAHRVAQDPPVPERAWYRIENAAGDTAELWIFDDIGYDWFTGSGVSSSAFAAALQNVTASAITLHLNSGGGNLFEALAIHALLKNHPAKVTVQVEGIAASAASIIAMAGDRILMARGSMMMIHEPKGITVGSAADHQKTAEFLGSVAVNMVGLYADHAGKKTDWRAAMLAETWYRDQEAVKVGLADEVMSQSAVQNDVDLSIYGYAHVPEALQKVRTADDLAAAGSDRVIQNITINNYGADNIAPPPDPTPDPELPEDTYPDATRQEPDGATLQEHGLSVVSARLLIDLAEAEVMAIA